MLKSADLHETILTPVICHKHIYCHDCVTLYFSVKFSSVASEKTRNEYFSYMSADLRAFWRKTIQKKKKRGKPRLNARNHWEFESIKRNLSAAVLQVKPSCNNSNLNDIGISLQRADSGSYYSLWQELRYFELSENCQKTDRKFA